jgi:hypothetical protein
MDLEEARSLLTAERERVERQLTNTPDGPGRGARCRSRDG